MKLIIVSSFHQKKNFSPRAMPDEALKVHLHKLSITMLIRLWRQPPEKRMCWLNPKTNLNCFQSFPAFRILKSIFAASTEQSNCMFFEFVIGEKNRDNLHWKMVNRRSSSRKRNENVEKNPTREIEGKCVAL